MTYPGHAEDLRLGLHTLPLLRHGTPAFPFTLGSWSDQVGRKDRIIRLQASGDASQLRCVSFKASISGRAPPFPMMSMLYENQPSLGSAADEGVARFQPCGENT